MYYKMLVWAECSVAFKCFVLKCVTSHFVGRCSTVQCVTNCIWLHCLEEAGCIVLYLVDLMAGPRDHRGQIGSNPLNAPESWHRATVSHWSAVQFCRGGTLWRPAAWQNTPDGSICTKLHPLTPWQSTLLCIVIHFAPPFASMWLIFHKILPKTAWIGFSDAIASPSTYSCQWVGQSVGHW